VGRVIVEGIAIVGHRPPAGSRTWVDLLDPSGGKADRIGSGASGTGLAAFYFGEKFGLNLFENGATSR
jgi:hypothetical protein